VRGYWRSLHKRDQLRLPLSTAASCLPALREAFTYCLPNHVDNWSVSYLNDAYRDGCHRGFGSLFHCFRMGLFLPLNRFVAH
jgi:hypothetical protein